MVAYHVLQEFQEIPERVMSSGLCLKFHRFQELHKLYNCSLTFSALPLGIQIMISKCGLHIQTVQFSGEPQAKTACVKTTTK